LERVFVLREVTERFEGGRRGVGGGGESEEEEG